MSLKVHIRPEAEKDIETAATWYEEQQKGLGKDFLDEVLGVFETISKRPNIFSVVHRKTRRAIVHRFPFGVFYRMAAGIVFQNDSTAQQLNSSPASTP